MNTYPKKIIIIDSDSACLALTVITIKNHIRHCVIKIFSDALLALDHIKTTDDYPDILFTDVHLPRMNGLRFINNINEYFQNTFYAPPPFDIILYSSYLDFDQICDKNDTGKGHSCLLRHLDAAIEGKPCEKLPIKACVRKPLNKNMLNHLLDDTVAKVTK